MAKRPVALEDLLRFKIVSETQISPDGKRACFCVKTIEKEKNRYRTALWMADTEGGEARPFTGEGHSDTDPRWSPDGLQIAFVSDRDDPKSQIYLIPSGGGEAQKLTNLDEGSYQALAWSPDGTRLAFLYRATPAEWTKKAKEDREESKASRPPRVHKRLFYRLDGFGYFDEEYYQLYVTDARTGETKKLTDEPNGVDAPSWSPDGRKLAFAAERSWDFDLHQDELDLCTIPADGGAIVNLTAAPGPKAAATWSPDGQWIAYAGKTSLDDPWGCLNDRVIVVPAEGGESRDLTGASDKAVGYLTLGDLHDVGGGALLQWAPDSTAIYFPVSEFGATRIYAVSLYGNELFAITPDNAEAGSFSLSADGTRLGVQLGSATEPHDAWIFDTQGEGKRLSFVNRDIVAEVELQEPERLAAPNSDGGTVDTWILKPAAFDPSKKYPTVLYVHGGPAMQYGGSSSAFHEVQWLAAEGYVVLFSNPRGSKGYGEAHTSAIKGDWGNKDWIDIQAVADYGAALPYVDGSRMAIMGGSYGGYMTAWAVGNTNRFRCAIADRLVSNRHSMSGTCDFPWQHGKFWKGNAWDDPSDLWAASPLRFAGNVTTPVLLIHSDGDLRCPVSQAEEFFAALRLQGKTVEFVRYPPESSHGLSRNGPPDLRIDRLQRNLAWLNRWLKG